VNLSASPPARSGGKTREPRRSASDRPGIGRAMPPLERERSDSGRRMAGSTSPSSWAERLRNCGTMSAAGLTTAGTRAAASSETAHSCVPGLTTTSTGLHQTNWCAMGATAEKPETTEGTPAEDKAASAVRAELGRSSGPAWQRTARGSDRMRYRPRCTRWAWWAACMTCNRVLALPWARENAAPRSAARTGWSTISRAVCPQPPYTSVQSRVILRWRRSPCELPPRPSPQRRPCACLRLPSFYPGCTTWQRWVMLPPMAAKRCLRCWRSGLTRNPPRTRGPSCLCSGGWPMTPGQPPAFSG